MKFKFSYTIDFNIDTERRRINNCFPEGNLKNKLHEITDLFSEGKFVECRDVIASLGYSELDECPEVEYVSSFITESLEKVFIFGENIEIC